MKKTKAKSKPELTEKKIVKKLKKATKTKTVTLHHHHAKPYRKRHLGLFVIFSVIFIVMLSTAIQYRSLINASITSAADFVRDLFSDEGNFDFRIHSTYGYNITYDQRSFFATAIDAENGDLVLGNDLSKNRPYSIVRVAPSFIKAEDQQSSLVLSYHQEITYPDELLPNLADIEYIALGDGQIKSSSFEKTSFENITINGQEYLKTIWDLKQSENSIAKIKTNIITYVTLVNNQPVTIVLNYSLGDSTGGKLYEPIIDSISFSTRKEQAFIAPTEQVASRIKFQKTMLDSMLFTDIASAETTKSTNSAEKVTALYGPAVVKLYNVFCMDIQVNNYSFATDICEGSAGSGFFISQDGLIGTNGHVAVADEKDIAIQYAVVAASKGFTERLEFLLALAGVTESDLAGKTNEEAAGFMIDELYGISDSYFTKSNYVINLLAELNDKLPDLEALVNATMDREKYTAEDAIKQANLVASDYVGILDGINGFKGSDVAIIDIEGDNYPITRLGEITDVSQGSDLFILGYPGNATENGIVDSTVNTVTLTSGKVSSIKNASGSDKKLIETDTTIGHGNSGGPALSDKGLVVGIATYSADGSGNADGVYNYIRDIKDLKDLANDSSITLNTKSETQTEWEKGINNFYEAHYSKSLKNFNRVKELYPYASRADEFIAAANKRIENGEDVSDFPVAIVAIIAGVSLIGVAVTVIIIVRHKKHHVIYQNQVGQGNIQPIVPGSPSQKVTVPVKPFAPFAPVAPVTAIEAVTVPTVTVAPAPNPTVTATATVQTETAKVPTSIQVNAGPQPVVTANKIVAQVVDQSQPIDTTGNNHRL